MSQDDTSGLVGTTSHFIVLHLGSDGIWVDGAECLSHCQLL